MSGEAGRELLHQVRAVLLQAGDDDKDDDDDNDANVLLQAGLLPHVRPALRRLPPSLHTHRHSEV